MSLVNEIQGIVISNMEYRENDLIVYLLTPHGMISYLAKGALKQTSKNRICTQPYSYVNISLTQSKLPVLTSGHVIESYYKIHQDLVKQSLCQVLCDCIKRTEIDEMLFLHFQKMLQYLQTDNEKAYTLVCICLKDILKKDGFGMHVNHCVLCHTQHNIETISIQDGGFLCHACNQNRYPVLKKEELIMYYSLFQYTENRLEEFIETYTFTIENILFLLSWYCQHEQIELKSISFLQTILNLGI